LRSKITRKRSKVSEKEKKTRKTTIAIPTRLV
jgi:hypothetical protein